jgi:hypothetical protein
MAHLQTQHGSMITKAMLAMRGGENHHPDSPEAAFLSVLPCPCTKRLIGIRKDAIMKDTRPISNVNQHSEPPFRMASGHSHAPTAKICPPNGLVLVKNSAENTAEDDQNHAARLCNLCDTSVRWVNDLGCLAAPTGSSWQGLKSLSPRQELAIWLTPNNAVLSGQR